MDKKGLKKGVFVPKIPFFVEHRLSEGIILNELSLRGSPTINFALGLTKMIVES